MLMLLSDVTHFSYLSPFRLQTKYTLLLCPIFGVHYNKIKEAGIEKYFEEEDNTSHYAS